MSNVRQQLTSGAVSGFASTVCLQPFDLLKTRLQQGDGVAKQRNTPLLFHTARNIVVTNGFAGLWRGTSATLIRNVPGVALYMTVLTQIRTVMAKSGAFSTTSTHLPNSSVLPKLSNQGNLIAGATARVGVGFIMNPFTVLKARIESTTHNYQSLSSGLASMLRMGPSDLFRGFWASSLRDAPYAGLFVVFYETIKVQAAAISSLSGSMTQSAFIHSASGALAGAMATISTHPFDVIKTKVQVRQEERYMGLRNAAVTIWKQRGPLGFFDGLSLRMSRKVLGSAIGWGAYEGLLVVMRRTKASTEV